MSPDSLGPDRLPPQNLDAERSVLGSMLRDNDVIDVVAQLIRADNFYLDAHRKIFQAISDLHDKGGQPVDLVLLAEELIKRGQLEDVGRAAYLAELWDAAPTAANAEYYAKIVRDKGIVRSLIHAGTEILRDAYEQSQPAEELLEGAERKILDVAQMGITGQTITLEQAIAETYRRIDDRATGKQKAGGLSTGFVDLNEITAGLHDGELIIVAARPSVGKCLAFDSEIVLEDGTVTTLEAIYKRRDARLLTLGEDWRLRPTEPSAYVDDGLKPVFRVTTRLGKTVESTLSHPFLTLDGWRPLAELKVGDRIAVPRRLDVFGTAAGREYEIKILAYLIGDGCLTDTTPEFTNGNPRLLDEFTVAVQEFGGLKVRKEANGQRTPTLHVASDPIFLAAYRKDFGHRLLTALKTQQRSFTQVAIALQVSPSLVPLWCKGKCVPSGDRFRTLCALLDMPAESLAPHTLSAIRKADKNPLTLWLQQLGLWGKGSREKFIPDFVFRLPRPQLALFLNRLFATDGWATLLTEGQTQLGYASVSERLTRQIQHLLLRFGILASLRRRSVKYKETRREAWQLDIVDQSSIAVFAAEIGMFGKEEALARVVEALRAKQAKTCRDTLPPSIWERLNAARGSEPWTALARRAGLGGHTNIHVGRRGLSRPRLMKLATALADASLQQLAEGDVYWDEIVSIESAGVKQVYDLTIPETHNFIANDICVHNTAFSLGIVRNVVTEEKEPVFFVSLEQSRIELAERLLCAQARVDSHRLRKGTLGSDDMDRLIDAGGVLRNAKLFIDDSPVQSMLRIAANARRLKLRHGIKLIVIDYLQLIEPDNRRDPRQEQVAQISRRLKALAKELQIPLIALAQVNRSSEDRQDHRPRLADLRESGSIEQDADTVMLLHRPDRYEPGQHEGIIEVIIGKQRNGPTGEITLAYLKQYMRYEDYAPGTPFEG